METYKRPEEILDNTIVDSDFEMSSPQESVVDIDIVNDPELLSTELEVESQPKQVDFNTTNASPVLTTIPVLAASPVKKTTKTVKLPTQKTIRKTIVSKKKPITVKKMTVKKETARYEFIDAEQGEVVWSNIKIGSGLRIN